VIYCLAFLIAAERKHGLFTTNSKQKKTFTDGGKVAQLIQVLSQQIN
jgi:hypothetical protein